MTLVDDFRNNGDWLAVALSVDVPNTTRCIEETGISPKTPGRWIEPYGAPYVQHLIPGTVAVGSGDSGLDQDEEGWLVQVYYAGTRGRHVNIHRLDFNPLQCDPVPECSSYCECEYEDGGERCDLCYRGCDCDACDLGENFCRHHDTRHQSYYF